MYKDKKIAVVIPAAGRGNRMGGSVPKQYLKAGGKAMLVRTAEIFRDNRYIDHIVVAAGVDHFEECAALLRDNGINAILAVGGETRQDSVYAGLKKLPADTDFVLVHDASRPFVTAGIIEAAINAVCEKRAVVCAVPVKDTIRMKQGEGDSVTLDRDRLYAVQTPQAFEKELIIGAYERAYKEGFYGTDDAALAERAGHHVHIIEGSYDNIKITTKGDMPVGGEISTGIGFDAHAFEAGRKLFLGGVEIPFDRGLSGHSDDDVLLHAVIDALLGAAGCRDIGTHFPDSEEKYRGISSLLLLEETAKIIAQKGYTIGNIDAVVIAERPKIAPYVSDMKKTAAGALGVAEDKINIKGTTTEKMGFTGREEGIAAQAVCMLYRA
jgi:2-C-methyl-D-erythritol 4-phosphate cytidylyltransferase/2-C-methyl-D-erythritol 2,4-cyclodiphosphate synthase